MAISEDIAIEDLQKLHLAHREPEPAESGAYDPKIGARQRMFVDGSEAPYTAIEELAARVEKRVQRHRFEESAAPAINEAICKQWRGGCDISVM
jgi:hypothetical protein